MIVKDPLDISVADFNAIKAIVKFNARFIQNSLGMMNMLEVGKLSGTKWALQPLMTPKEGAVGANAMAKGTVVPPFRRVLRECRGEVHCDRAG
jgi:hypothetical protein